MNKVRVGVLGAHRGMSMIEYCKSAYNAEVVAVCDKAPYELDKVKDFCREQPVELFDNFDEFIKCDMDAVVLANYAHEHAPFAVRAMNEGKHVFSEVLPVQTMSQAVELVETVERTGKIYAYGENYCYMAAPREMKKLYSQGIIGNFEYGEGEYLHNCEPIWHEITYGEKNHWRNNMYSTFYCTHSLGPIIHITGLRPVAVTGFESFNNQRRMNGGSRAAQFGIEMVTLENGALIKSIHGGLYKGNISYVLYGSKGRMESARHDSGQGDQNRIYINVDDFEGQYKEEKIVTYLPDERENNSLASDFGHGGSDFYSMYYFIEKILGNESADIIDVYEALDMCLPGMFAFRSVLNEGKQMKIPNLRNKNEREKWRNDTACTDPSVAGDMLLPTRRGGTPDIPDEIYDNMKKKWDRFLSERK